jgi:hypothetical protein
LREEKEASDVAANALSLKLRKVQSRSVEKDVEVNIAFDRLNKQLDATLARK